MTEVAPEAPAEEGWDAPERDADVSYPEYPSNPHNHRYTLSYDPQKPPFLVVRANTVEELQASFEELEEGGVYAAMGNAWRVMKAQATVGAGMGPTTPVPQPPGPVQPVQPVPLPQSPQAQYPQPAQAQPGVPGTAPAQWQNVGAPPPPPVQGGFNGGSGNRAEPKPRPPWPQVYRISIARGDTSFKDYRAANQQYFKGKVLWAGGGDYWINGEVVQSVAQWKPVPA